MFNLGMVDFNPIFYILLINDLQIMKFYTSVNNSSGGNCVSVFFIFPSVRFFFFKTGKFLRIFRTFFSRVYKIKIENDIKIPRNNSLYSVSIRIS